MSARPTPPVHRRLLATLAVTGVATVLVGACGVPDSSGFEPIDPEEIPFGPNDATTTPTTSEATTTSSNGSLPVSSTTSIATTTTVVDTEPVELYFVTGSSLDPRLTSITRALSRPAVLSQVIAALEDGPPAEIGTGLQTLIPSGLVSSVTERGGVAVVELDSEAFGDVIDSEQDPLIAQLVLTLGRRPGVGQVQFVSEGEPFLVRVPSRGNILSSSPVAADDFESLLSDAVNPPPTSDAPPTSGPGSTSTTTTPPRRPTTSTTTTQAPRQEPGRAPGGSAP